MTEQQLLLRRIKQYDFSLKELNLYLDTHPNCRRALALFKKYTALRKDCLDEYTDKYGPITPEQNKNDQHWSWISDPWPWERR